MGASANKSGFVAEINVTPFVDVMLVLLIIFMVTAPMMTEGLEVALPRTRTVQSLPAEDDSVIMTLGRAGEIFLDECPLPPGELADGLRRLVAARQRKLFLKADKDVPYGEVVRVMAEIRAAGIEKFGVVAEQTEDAGR